MFWDVVSICNGFPCLLCSLSLFFSAWGVSWKDMANSFLGYSFKIFILAMCCLSNLYQVLKAGVLHLPSQIPLIVGKPYISIIVGPKKQTGELTAVFVPSIHPLNELYSSLRAKRLHMWNKTNLLLHLWSWFREHDPCVWARARHWEGISA